MSTKRELRVRLADAEGYARALREANDALSEELREERSIGEELRAQRDEAQAPDAPDREATSAEAARDRALMFAQEPVEAGQTEWGDPITYTPDCRRVAPGDTIWLTDREGGELQRVVVQGVTLYSADQNVVTLRVSKQ
jgi:hypothetical protein